MMELRHVSTDGPLPTSEFRLIVDGREVGTVLVRHRPSHGHAIPPEAATHISYEIVASERRKGFGVAILRLALVEARKIGLTEVHVGADESNTASREIIERNGGELVTVFNRLDTGGASRHYRIIL